MILLGGALGLLFIYTKANIALKVLTVYLFINCFLSKAPYLSFTSYLSFISVAYYYLLASRLKDFKFVVNIAQALFFLNIILIVNQQFGRDTLLNFARPIPVCFGTIGNPMWLGSLLSCLAPFLLMSSFLNIIPLVIICFISKSSGMALSLAMGILVYGFLTHRRKVAFWSASVFLIIVTLIFAWSNHTFYKFGWSRGPVWKKTIQLANQHPFMGWGIGTYKIIFPALSQDVANGIPGKWEYEGTKGDWLAWRQAHNCWLQILFETGYTGLTILLTFAGIILFRLFKTVGTQNAISGFVIIASNMSIHYPTRLMQSVLFIIVFLAFCAKLTLKEEA